MRTSFWIFLIGIVLAVSAAGPERAAAAGPETAFIAWALEKGSEMDLRWGSMTGSAVAATAGASDEILPATGASSASARTAHGTELSHKIITSRSFVHRVTTNADLLPLSTRDRNGPARGVSRLQSPAKARLSIPHSVKRPLNSRIQQKNFFRTFGPSISRPKLDSFGRINKTAHGRSGAARPSHRASRPRVL